MPPKDDLVYVGHMLDSAQKAVTLLKGKSREDFDNDETLLLAIAHLIQIIGEAARQVSKPFCDSHADIPWKAIVGMRNKVVHDYMDLDADIVWDTATRELSQLSAHLQKIVPPEQF